MTAPKKDVVVDEKAANQALGRKAYGDAMAFLRENHKDEFLTLLDGAYRSLGLESPHAKREARVEAAAVAKAAAEERREARRVAKIARLKAELEAAEGYPALALALESVATADQVAS